MSLPLAERWKRDRPVFRVDGVVKYRDDQPREPAGGPGGGRFTSGGGSGADEGNARETHAAAWESVTRQIRRDFPTRRGGKGNCYEAAVTLMMNRHELGLTNVTVVQATCEGRGALEGKRFGHSWLEADGPEVAGQHMRTAYDFANGNEVEMPAVVYRYFGHATDVHEFTPEEALVQMVATEHYGPWIPTGDDVL